MVSVRSGVAVGASPEPLCPGCPPGLRSFERSREERSARRAAFVSIESFEGGIEEFLELIPSRRRNSAFSASRLSTRATSPTISAASSSYDGCGGSGADTTQMIDDQRPHSEPDTPSPLTDVLINQDRLTSNGPAQPDP
jgi:hypothetical protein